MFHILATGGRSSTVQGDSFFYKTKFFIVYFPFKLVNNKGCMLNISRGFSFLKFCSCIFEKKSAFTRICINNKWVNRSLCGYRDKVGSSGAAQEANKLRAEVAAPSWKSCIFVMFLHNRLHLLLPRQGNIKKKKDVRSLSWCRGLISCEKNAVWAVLVSSLFMSHSCWQPLFTSHISYLRRRGSAHVCEGSVGGWEGAIIPSVGIMCALGGFNSLAVEAECLNVASRLLFTLSFNYLCPPPTFFGAKLI